MRSIGAFEAKTHFSALLEKVEKGEVIVITKHGKAIARLSPLGSNKTTVKNAITELKQFQSKHQFTLNGLDWKTLRDEGRK
jgi:prevent-host-death family protein